MVAFNMIWKFSLVVAFGLSATATSTDVAQEQPKKESFVSRFFNKKEEPAPKTKEIPKPVNTETQENTKTADPPVYSIEWYLLPKPENRKQLIEVLPWAIAISVPNNCNKRISPAVENRIKWYLSWIGLQWFLIPKPKNRAALRSMLPADVVVYIPEDCNKRVDGGVLRYIWHYFTLCAADWLLLPRPENRAHLREELPWDLAAKVPEDCNEPIDQEVENEIRKHFSETFQQQRLDYSWSYAGSS